MGLIREPKGVDFIIEPHEVTEEEHLAMLAFVAACREKKMEQKRKLNQIKQSFKHVVAAL
jgi:hypothetical protein